MTLKILGLGFYFGKYSYLSDYWNILDFTIVVTSYIPIILTTDDSNVILILS